MSFEQALKEEMESVAGLSGNVFPLRAPESFSPPYLVYMSSEGTPDQILTGFLTTKEVSFDLNLIHATYGDLKALAPLVVSKLQSFLFRNIGTAGPYIQEITYDDPVEMYEPEIELYRCLIQAKVRF